MRDIKFRAYYDRRWYQPALVGGTQVPQVFNSNSDLVNLCVDTENYYVCQYTGLKDKNGVEIYEGDILRHTWQDKSASLTTVEEDVVYTTDNNDTSITIAGLSFSYSEHTVEVIGNIYENPELLEGIL